MSAKGKLKNREWIVILIFLGLLGSILLISRLSDHHVDQEIEKHLNL